MTTPQLEKVYFNFILKNKKYFDLVKTHFFKNSEIQFVYNVIRDYMLKNTEAENPSPRQILDMVSMVDHEGVITKEILKSILQVNLKEYDEKNFIEPNFNSWILVNRIKSGAVDIVEEIRGIETSNDFITTVDTANKIKAIAEDMSSVKFIDDEDMGSDFDDAETHVQDNARFKVKSGFETFDHILGGGWDIGTLNIIMLKTNGGKCENYNTSITIRGKKEGVVEKIKIGEFFERIEKNSNK